MNGPAYQPHSPTSREAAESVAESAPSLRGQVFALIEREGRRGLTDEEIQDLLAIGGNTERPRRRELVKMRAIIDSGATRKNRSGREATVWVVNPDLEVPKGQLALELLEGPDPDDLPW